MRSKSKVGEGTLEDFNTKVQREFQKRGMVFIEGEDPKINFEAMEKSFLQMKKLVEELYRKAQGGAETSIKVERKGGSEEPQ